MVRFTLVVIFVFLSLGQAFAAADLSKWRCEDPALIKVLDEKVRTSVVDGGRAVSSYGTFLEKIVSSKTVSAARNKLICDLRLRIKANGATRTVRARQTIQQFGEKLSLKLSIDW